MKANVKDRPHAAAPMPLIFQIDGAITVRVRNRHGLVVDATVTHATGKAERKAALTMLSRMKGRHRITLAGQSLRYSRIRRRLTRHWRYPARRPERYQQAIRYDGRTTRHPGYAISMRIRKRIEEVFRWAKTSGNLRRTRHRGQDRVGWNFTLTAAAYNLVRMLN